MATTKEQIKSMVHNYEFVTMSEEENFDGNYYVFVDDFAGFTENWDEEYNEQAGVEFAELEAYMEKHAASIVEGWHTVYQFDGFSVEVSFSHEDI